MKNGNAKKWKDSEVKRWKEESLRLTMKCDEMKDHAMACDHDSKSKKEKLHEICTENVKTKKEQKDVLKSVIWDTDGRNDVQKHSKKQYQDHSLNATSLCFELWTKMTPKRMPTVIRNMMNVHGKNDDLPNATPQIIPTGIRMHGPFINKNYINNIIHLKQLKQQQLTIHHNGSSLRAR